MPTTRGNEAVIPGSAPKNTSAGPSANSQFTYGPGGSGRIAYQQPFDMRMVKRVPLSGTTNGTLHHGRMYMASAGRSRAYYGLNFLFNPSEIQIVHTLDAQLPPDAASLADAGRPIGGSGEFAFSLLFDRTYELWDRQTTAAGKFGCYVDVRQLYLMLGIIDPESQFTESAKDKGIPYALNNITAPNGPMYAQPMWVYFGSNFGSTYANNYRSLKYYGVITSLNVTYTSFTQFMTPRRCVVNVSFQNWAIGQSGTDEWIEQGDSASSATSSASRRGGEGTF